MEKNSQPSLVICSRYLNVSPQKMRLVVNVVRRKNLTEAVNILQFLPQKGSKILMKILQGARKQLKKEEEINIREVRVDRGTIRKKTFPRAKGSADTIRSVNCHLTLRLGIKNEKIKYGAKN